MRVISLFFALSIAGMPFAALAANDGSPTHLPASFSRMAPADEYFGRQKESILEIRNRLDSFDRRSDSDMMQPDTRHALDDLNEAIRDWQRKYPHDPWLPRSMRRLLRDYQRAGSAASVPALDLIAILQASYGDTDTADSIAGVFNQNETQPADDYANVPDVDTDTQAPEAVSVQGTVVDADSGQPIAGAVIFVSSSEDASDLASAPFGTTADDGSFAIANCPAATLQLTIRPPSDSGYAPMTLTVDATAGDVDAGVIRLTAAS